MKKLIFISALLYMNWLASAQNIAVINPIPSKKQVDWQALEYYGFIHFNMNTFTNLEWGEGQENPVNFNPTNLDCNQWARIAKKAGMKGLILTVKHHDGFALYPSKFTTHTVAKSNWKNGKGDVVKELSEACKKYGIKLGIYLSPWDRNHPDYGTDKYNFIYAEMQKELLTNYGPIFEFWYDGANGEGPNGKKQIYDWPLFNNTVLKYQPNAIQFSDSGPDIRWVGNERGFAYDKTWSPINRDEIYPGFPKFNLYRNGQQDGSHWVSPEVDVSIRPGWYYHADQDLKVKSPDSLMKIYVASVGKNSNLLLNIPVDRRGLIHPNDSISMIGFKQLRDKGLVNLLTTKDHINTSSNHSGKPNSGLIDKNSKTFWAANIEDQAPKISIKLQTPKMINALLVQEPIFMGQRIIQFKVTLTDENGAKEEIFCQTIGNKRIVTFNQKKVKNIEIDFLKSRGQVLISNVEVLHLISTRNEPLYQ
jgi:alpha-L-fucosidase